MESLALVTPHPDAWMKAHDPYVERSTIGASPRPSHRPIVTQSHITRTLERWLQGVHLPLTLRDWTDLEGRRWSVRLETGPPPVVVFRSEDELVTVEVQFTDGLEGRSDAALERLLDDGRGNGNERGGH